MLSHILTWFATPSICFVASSSVNLLYTLLLSRLSSNAQLTYVEVLMRARPRFLSQLTTMMLVQSARMDIALVWNRRRLVYFGLLTLSYHIIWQRKELVQLWVSLGMSYDLGIHSDLTCGFG